ERDVLDAGGGVAEALFTALCRARRDQLDAGVAARVIPGQAGLAVAASPQGEAHALELAHVPVEIGDDDPDVIDPSQHQTATGRPSCSASSQAAATRSVRTASAGPHATAAASPFAAASRKRRIDRSIGSAADASSVPCRETPV